MGQPISDKSNPDQSGSIGTTPQPDLIGLCVLAAGLTLSANTAGQQNGRLRVGNKTAVVTANNDDLFYNCRSGTCVFSCAWHAGSMLWVVYDTDGSPAVDFNCPSCRKSGL